MSALDVQVGGDHYKKYAIQPADFIMRNNIPWAEGSILQYVVRWRDKGGIDDLKKAKHLIDMLIDAETVIDARIAAQQGATTSNYYKAYGIVGFGDVASTPTIEAPANIAARSGL